MNHNKKLFKYNYQIERTYLWSLILIMPMVSSGWIVVSLHAPSQQI